MKNAAAQYLREVNKQLRCPNSIKKEFLHQLENEMQFFCSDHNGADFATLSEQFGPPDEMAEEFLSQLGEQAVLRCSRTRRKLQVLTIGVILTAVAFAVLIGVQITSLQQQLPEGEFIAAITYEEASDSGTPWLPSQGTIFGSK